MKYPSKLKDGATIGLVSPSSPIPAERVGLCRKVLEDMGFHVKLSDNHADSKGGYMAGDEKLRAAWINKMFGDSEVDAVFCVRGGDGATRIIPYIDTEMIRKNPKVFVGYSDITCLHLLFNQTCGLVTFHGPMVSSNMVDHFDPESKKAFFDCINADREYVYQPPEGYPLKPLKDGRAFGPMTGGNLTLMAASLGTPYEMDTKGRIILIEEIGEHMGNVDRHIYQLKNAGKFKEAAGILIGQFSDCTGEEPYGIEDIIMDATEGLHLPIMSNIQSGHGFPMINLPMGAFCEINTQRRSLRFFTER